jgi:diguanylate cyclase (GGDEF)-like protein/PAS domain S-box-containing protein
MLVSNRRLRAAASALRRAESRWRGGFDSANAHVCVLDASGRIVEVNAAWQRFGEANGLAPGRGGVGADYLAVCAIPTNEPASSEGESDARDGALARGAIADVLAGRRDSASLEYACHAPDERRWFEMSVVGFGRGRDRGAIVRHVNVTRELLVQRELRRQADFVRVIDESLPVIFFERTVQGGEFDYRFNGDRFFETFGLPPDELWTPGGAWAELIEPADRRRVVHSYAAAIEAGGGIWRCEFRAHTLDGDYRWFRAVVNIVAPAGRELRSAGMIQDISDVKAAHERADYARDHDELTGLFGRVYFERAVATRLEQRLRTGKSFAVVIVDIDDFREINEAFGVETGDELLRIVARAMEAVVRETDLIARISGDQFGVVADVPSADEARSLAAKLVEHLGGSYALAGRSVRLTVSAGIAVPAHLAATCTELLHEANVAAGAALAAGGGAAVVFSTGLNDGRVVRATLKSELREALATGQFELYYQPKVDLRFGTIVGCEALIRRNHPTLGLQSPGAFVAVAEETGLIVQIGEWVAREACRQSVAWREAGLDPVPIAINLSTVQFARSDVLASLADAFATSRAAPGALDVEVTESVFMDFNEQLVETLEKIRALGIEIGLDDFGTGFSSLAYLTRLPLSTIKIDQCFVRGALERPRDAAIVRWVVRLAGELGLRAVAEGVETREQLEFVRSVGCAEAQGYFLGRPMPAASFERLLREARYAPSLKRSSE